MQKTSSIHQPQVSPYLVLFFSILSISTASLFIRYAQLEVPSLVIALYRMAIASVVTVCLLRSRHIQEFKRLAHVDWLKLILSGTFLALHFAAWVTSLEFTSVASSVVLVTTTPIWVALFSPWVLKEKISKQTFLFLGIAFLGSLLVIFAKTGSIFEGQIVSSAIKTTTVTDKVLLGNLLALFGAFMAAGYVMEGRLLRKSLSNISYTSGVYVVASFFLLIFCLVFQQRITGYSMAALQWLFLLAIIAQLLGHSLINWLLGKMPASVVSTALLGEPVGSSLFALIILGEVPVRLEVVGGVLILIGIALSIFGSGTNSQRRSSSNNS
jgi:drug/metabolite transporter (DMT)-like permease